MIMIHIPRPHPALFPSIRELVRELPSGATLFDIADELETLGASIFDLDISPEIAAIMREKIAEFTRIIREYRQEEKEKERESARSEIALIFEGLTGRDEQPRTALLIALDPLCIRGGDERISLRSELAPGFSSLPAHEITESLLMFGPREKIVKIAKGLRHDLLKIKSSSVAVSLRRIDNFIQKFKQQPPDAESAGGEKGGEEHGFQPSSYEQSV